MDPTLAKLAKESTDRVEREGWKYYYQAGDYKFNNVFLANWFEQENNCWAEFVAQHTDRIRSALSNTAIDLNADYASIYLKKLRSEKDYLRLFFSGGGDSLTVLDRAQKCGVYIDELVSFASGDSIDLPENQEIAQMAIPSAKKYQDTFGKHTVVQSGRTQEQFYSDPYYLYKQPEAASQFPMFRKFYTLNGYGDGSSIVGPDKPELLHYRGEWYTLCMDHSFGGYYNLNNLIYYAFDPDNIKTLIQESILYRNYLVNNNLLKQEPNSFYKIVDQGSVDIINRIIPDSVEKSLAKVNQGKKSFWAEKDIHALSNLIENQELDLLIDYFTNLKTLVNTQPYYNSKQKTIGFSKFCWAINIDTLEVFTQSELIPNGFEE